VDSTDAVAGQLEYGRSGPDSGLRLDVHRVLELVAPEFDVAHVNLHLPSVDFPNAAPHFDAILRLPLRREFGLPGQSQCAWTPSVGGRNAKALIGVQSSAIDDDF